MKKPSLTATGLSSIAALLVTPPRPARHPSSWSSAIIFNPAPAARLSRSGSRQLFLCQNFDPQHTPKG